LLHEGKTFAGKYDAIVVKTIAIYRKNAANQPLLPI